MRQSVKDLSVHDLSKARVRLAYFECAIGAYFECAIGAYFRRTLHLDVQRSPALFVFLFKHHFCSPAKLVGDFTLSDLPDRPRS